MDQCNFVELSPIVEFHQAGEYRRNGLKLASTGLNFRVKAEIAHDAREGVPALDNIGHGVDSDGLECHDMYSNR